MRPKNKTEQNVCVLFVTLSNACDRAYSLDEIEFGVQLSVQSERLFVESVPLTAYYIQPLVFASCPFLSCTEVRKERGRVIYGGKKETAMLNRRLACLCGGIASDVM